MLHVPSLSIFALKEQPLSSKDSRMALKDWLSLLQSLRCEQIVEVQECFWNNPEGYVSIVTEKACLSLQVVRRYYRQNLMESVGNLPESCIFAIIKDVL
jgi:hypothetical protein